MSARYFVGIDLGTTNCVVSYIDNEAQSDQTYILDIPQCMQDGSVQTFKQLPSSIYTLAKDEVSKINVTLPWKTLFPTNLVGHGALQLGQKRSGQLVQSAKSWLSFNRVDRKANILPWGSDFERKLSPFNATVIILNHIKGAWDYAFPNYPLSEQKVALTLPASFDEEARSLTLEAAEKNALTNLYLLEEPQAACYNWIANESNTAALADRKMLLVVDIGGGTTDFSLVAISKIDNKKDTESKLHLKRIAVGEHLLLGGDNIDQALAFQLDTKQIASLSSTRLAALVQQTRLAKETLLSEQAADSMNITVLGSGSRLIGGAQKFLVEKNPLIEQIENGFFPIIDLKAPLKQKQYGVQSLNLPYEQDPSIHAHLADFLTKHVEEITTHSGQTLPDAVLFNGGLFNSSKIKERIIEQLYDWCGHDLYVCDGNQPDTSVAEGAAYYAYGLVNEAVKIESGSPHSLFLEMADGSSVCILPKGSPRGENVVLKDVFSVTLGSAVQFSLYRADDRLVVEKNHQLDSTLSLYFISNLSVTLENELTELAQIDVRLSSQLTEVGTLSIILETLDQSQQWTLKFNHFQEDKETEVNTSQVHASLGEAEEALVGCFSKATKQKQDEIKKLRNTLESILGPRDSWNLATARALSDKLLALKSGRNKSASHERQWLMLTGFCLRPGYGFEGDESRVNKLSNILASQPHHDENSVWSQYWTAWRRIAGGLTVEKQKNLLDCFTMYFSPTAQRSREKQKQLLTRAGDDLVRLVGGLEYLPVTEKKSLADLLLKRLSKSSEPDTAWWVIGRLANRNMLYAGETFCLSEDIVLTYLSACLKEDWKKRKQAGLAAVLMAQSTDESSKALIEKKHLS
ncbi:Hsp70 family protein [Marinomonas sp. 15G1-11]|uniref:Hsp70 family protein n=1 Tax=Marinomonas phaeophyticola TaxID=3004091 RepID=A0ABT4JPT1_9GAMM|nr:hsp70 family protein [Marinomonas sp. 15G1-11]MCZ2720373.1 Hsp70 family protein [Marinomonas sp. 15G1-11]